MDCYSGIIDTHAHYLDRAFDQDRDAVLTDLKKAGVSAIIEMPRISHHQNALSDLPGNMTMSMQPWESIRKTPRICRMTGLTA